MSEIDELRAKALGAGRGYVPDPADFRDLRLTAAAPIEEATVRYDENFLPVRDQGDEGTCVAFASTAVKEFYDNKQRGTAAYFSPRHLYFNAKRRDDIPTEEGTYPRVAMQVLQDVGVAFEHDWPYVPHQKMLPENEAALDAEAATQKIARYARLISTRDMVASLMLNGPFLAGVTVTDGWYTDECLRTGVVDAKVPAKPDDGGHAICVCGYDVDRRAFRIRNSWGPRYGDGGYLWIARDWMAEFCLDAWAAFDDTLIDAGLVVKPLAS